jgi:phosphoglycerate dehydrogenase-like enzyme
MNIALLQVPLTLSELNQLSKEFPQILFLSFPRHSLQPISKEHWSRSEVFFGEKITAEELAAAHSLRWIHTPTAQINRLCLKEIKEQGNVLISNTREENLFQKGEYVIAAVLAFAKNLFQWKEADHFPAIVWDCKWRSNMWTLQDKIFLQIGMGREGLEIARRAKEAGMEVWGMDEIRTFHPFCSKQLQFEELRDAVAEADVVSICLARERGALFRMGKEELNRMKPDSILSILGSSQEVDEEALADLSASGKFRGIVLDAYYQTPIPPQSPLWKIPRMLITPEVAMRPKKQERSAFHLFRFNLRQYLHGNFADMKNLIDPSLVSQHDGEDWD